MEDVHVLVFTNGGTTVAEYTNAGARKDYIKGSSDAWTATDLLTSYNANLNTETKFTHSATSLEVGTPSIKTSTTYVNPSLKY